MGRLNSDQHGQERLEQGYQLFSVVYFSRGSLPQKKDGKRAPFRWGPGQSGRARRRVSEAKWIKATALGPEPPKGSPPWPALRPAEGHPTQRRPRCAIRGMDGSVAGRWGGGAGGGGGERWGWGRGAVGCVGVGADGPPLDLSLTQK